MQATGRAEGSTGVAAALVVAALLLSAAGCADNLYAECTIADELDCQQESASSCVAEPVFDCDSRVCGRYRKSRPFCTKPCSSDGDCNSGVCKTFVRGTGEQYCVQKRHVDG